LSVWRADDVFAGRVLLVSTGEGHARQVRQAVTAAVALLQTCASLSHRVARVLRVYTAPQSRLQSNHRGAPESHTSGIPSADMGSRSRGHKWIPTPTTGACRPLRTGGNCKVGNEPDGSFNKRNNVKTFTMLTGLPATDSWACEHPKGTSK
jgi:hypothetical protein